MRTVIIGGGKGCESLLGLVTGTFLKEMTFNVRCVVDINPDAPGMIKAQELGIPVSTDMRTALSLPETGDEIRQGSVCLQVFSNDLRAQSLLSPLSGTVTKVNELVTENPNEALQSPYETGWLIQIDPSRYDEEKKLLDGFLAGRERVQQEVEDQGIQGRLFE